MDKKYKLRRSHINLQQRLDIVQRLDKGADLKVLANKYKISYSTVKKISNQKEEIVKACKNINEATLHKKTQIKKCVEKKLDMAMMRYYQQSISCNKHVNEEMLLEKADIFANMLSFKNFVSTDIWLDKFKCRYNLDLKRPQINLIKKDMKILLDHEIINVVGEDMLEDVDVVEAEVDDIRTNERNDEISVNKDDTLNLLGVLPNDIIANNDDPVFFADDQLQIDDGDKHKDPDETTNDWIKNIKMTVNESPDKNKGKQHVIDALKTVQNTLNNLDIVPCDIYNAFYLMQDYIKKQLSEN